jgi:hypothetical protein
MAKRYTAIILCISIVFSCGLTAHAGGNLQGIDVTGLEPAPFGGGFLKGHFADEKWDARCIPVQFTVDNNADPIPNPNGPAFLSLATVKAALQRAMDSWNAVPTSYSNLQLTGEQHSSGPPGFDMVNEIAFRQSPFTRGVGFSFPVTLAVDVNLNDGDEIDGDGDSDVSAAISGSTDVDHDGDIEFPAGFYKAGTILDADVYLNTDDYTFTVSDAELGNPFTYDVEGILVHEFGHSQGLSHSMDNQVSDTNGLAPTMYPFVGGWDPDNELSQRTLASDDQSWISYFYPEGSAGSGPAALQNGDVAFDEAYGLIKGELTHGWRNVPLLGGAVYAINKKTGERIVSGFSGVGAQFYTNGDFFVLQRSFLDGHYVLPVPKGDYIVGIEPVDAEPADPGRFNFVTVFGGGIGLNDFNEQFYDINNSSALPSEATSIHVNAGQTVDHIDITTAKNLNISNYGGFGFYGFVDHAIYAQRIPGSQIAAANGGQDILIQAAAFHTFPFDPSTVPVFAEAELTTGVVNPDLTATIDLNNPLDRTSRFVGQEDDFAPFYFHNPKQLGTTVKAGIATGQIQDLFILLKAPDGPFPGHAGIPPLIALDDNPGPLLNSYISLDNGHTFFPIIFNYRASLWMSAAK